MTEKEIQKFLWDNKDRFKELIDPISLPNKFLFSTSKEAIWHRTPEQVIFNDIVDRLESIYKRLSKLELFGVEVPLKKEGTSTIRADLLGVLGGEELNLAIIELKKSAQTERQAFTELLGYASHLRAIFPAMTSGDIHYILISPMKERIIREAFLLNLIIEEKPVFALIPTYQNDDITTLRLVPWVPDISDLTPMISAAFSDKNIDIIKVYWDEIEDWNLEKGESPSGDLIMQMNLISSYAAQLMESRQIHGFVYTAQAHPERPESKKNVIVVAGINPYRVSKYNYLISKHKKLPFEVDTIKEEKIGLLEIIPELAAKAKDINHENDYLEALQLKWGKTLLKVAKETIKTMTANSKEATIDTSSYQLTWEGLKNYPSWDGYGFQYTIYPTGLLRKLFSKYSVEDYHYVSKFGSDDHPYLNHGDIPKYFRDYFDNDNNFRHFLYNLFNYQRDINKHITPEVVESLIKDLSKEDKE